MASPIIIKIAGDVRELQSALGDADHSLGGFMGSVGRTGLALGAAFTAIGVTAGVHFFNLGEDLVSLDTRIQTVFGGSIGIVEEWSDQVAHRMGLTRTQAEGLAAATGDLLVPMGFTRDQAARMSTELVGLSGALSEWSNGQYDATQVADILNAAVLGERDALQGLGISISAAEVEARALQIAQAEGRNEVTAMDEALATQQLIFERSTDAQAAYAEGGNELTAAQNELKAKFGEIQESIARRLLPVFLDLASFVTDDLIPAVEEIVGAFNIGGLEGVADLIDEKFGPDSFVARAFHTFVEIVRAIPPTFEAVRDAVTPVLEELGALISSAFGAVEAIVRTVVGVLETLWGEFGDDILETARDLVEPIAQVFNGIKDTLTGIFDAIKAILTGKWGEAWQAIQDTVAGVWQTITGLFRVGWEYFWGYTEAIWEAFKSLASDTVDDVVGFFTGLPGRLLDLVGDLLGAAADLGEAIVDGLIDGLSQLGSFASDLGDAVFDAFKGAWNSFVDFLNRNATPSIDLPGPLGSVGLSDDFWDILRLAHGAVISSPTLAWIGENPSTAPEIVTPERLMRQIVREETGPGARKNAAGSVINVNVKAETNADPYEIAREVAWNLRVKGAF